MQDSFTLTAPFYRSAGLNRYRGIGYADSRDRTQPYLRAEYFGLVQDLARMQKDSSKQASDYAHDAYKDATRTQSNVQGTRAVRVAEKPLTIMMAGEDLGAPLGYSELPAPTEIDYSPIGYGDTQFAGSGAKKRVVRKKRAPSAKKRPSVRGGGWWR